MKRITRGVRAHTWATKTIKPCLFNVHRTSISAARKGWLAGYRAALRDMKELENKP